MVSKYSVKGNRLNRLTCVAVMKCYMFISKYESRPEISRVW